MSRPNPDDGDENHDKSSKKDVANDSDSDSDSDTDPQLDEDLYIVERIVRMRTTKKGKVQYLLKWKGFSESENTWEPAEHLECPELVAEFLEGQKQKEKEKEKEKEKQQASTSKTSENSNGKRSRSTSSTHKNSDDESNNNSSSQTKRSRIQFHETGYGRGLAPDALIGATDIYDGELMFLVKWKGVNKPELVPSRIVNKQSPQLVIKFYEERLTWNSTKGNNSSSNNKKVSNSN